MIGAIVRKEIREIARDGRFRVAAITVLVLLVAALAVGWRAAASAHAERDAAANLARSHWVNQPAKNPHSAAHYGVYAFKPKTPLSFVDDGVDPYTGVLAYLEAHVQNDFTHRPAADGTALSRFGALTAAGVLQVLVPLLIVVLAAGTIAGEREQGTLRQLLSVGARSRDLAIGKMLGLGGALMLLLIPATIIGVAALLVGTDGSGSGSRFLLLAAVYLGYFIVWIALSFAVSAWAPSTRAALICLLGRAIASHADFFARLGLTPSADPDEVLAVIEHTDRADRWRGYGYLFGYPDPAVDFFVEAGIRGDSLKTVIPRDFRRVETYHKWPAERGGPPTQATFVYAVPKDAPETPEDIALRDRAAPIYAEYLRRRPSRPGEFAKTMGRWVRQLR